MVLYLNLFLGNEFYSCEAITDSPIKKINGGEFMLKND